MNMRSPKQEMSGTPNTQSFSEPLKRPVKRASPSVAADAKT